MYKYPRLKYFMSCYYHQDWMDEVESNKDVDVWAYFFNSEVPEVSIELNPDIKNLLTKSDFEILETLVDYQSGGKCWVSGEDAKKWLFQLYEYSESQKT